MRLVLRGKIVAIDTPRALEHANFTFEIFAISAFIAICIAIGC